MSNYKLLIPIIVGLLVSLGSSWLWGYRIGLQSFYEEKLAYMQEQAKLVAEYKQRENNLTIETINLQEKINELEKKYKEDMDNVSADYALCMWDSKNRISIYSSQAEGSEAERERLAKHTAELDKSLARGRQLVAKLRTTLKQREDQLKLLNKHIKDLYRSSE